MSDADLWTSTIIGTQGGVRAGLMGMVACLRRSAIVDDDLGTVELVLGEVMNNIVEHAYADRTDGLIEVTIGRRAASLSVQVSDGGIPLPGLTLPQGNPANIDVDIPDMPEGGFGWSLIRHLARDLGYTRIKGKNRLTFLIPLSFSSTLDR